MTKKPKTVRVSDIEVTPITAKERRKINERIKKRYERLRKRYKEIHGKKVDWVDHNFEEGWLYINIRFTDGTNFSLDFAPAIVTRGIEYSDMSSGDEEIIRTYFLRRD